MSDFLSRLAGRALGQTPVARPRLPARFESAGGLAAGEAFDGSGVPDRAAPPPPAPPSAPPEAAVPRLPTPPRPAAGPTESEAVAHPAANLAEATPPSPELRSDKSPSVSPRQEPAVPELRTVGEVAEEPQRRPPADLPTSTKGPERGSATAEPSLPAAQPTMQATPRQREDEGRRQPVTTSDAPSHLPIPAASLATQDPTQEETSQAEPPLADSIDPPAFPLPEPAATPRQSLAAGLRSDQTSTADSEPTVRVTIGRIEVRAVTPPAAKPPRRRPAAPRMSLGDYLQARREGRR